MLRVTQQTRGLNLNNQALNLDKICVYVIINQLHSMSASFKAWRGTWWFQGIGATELALNPHPDALSGLSGDKYENILHVRLP